MEREVGRNWEEYWGGGEVVIRIYDIKEYIYNKRKIFKASQLWAPIKTKIK